MTLCCQVSDILASRHSSARRVWDCMFVRIWAGTVCTCFNTMSRLPCLVLFIQFLRVALGLWIFHCFHSKWLISFWCPLEAADLMLMWERHAPSWSVSSTFDWNEIWTLTWVPPHWIAWCWTLDQRRCFFYFPSCLACLLLSCAANPAMLPFHWSMPTCCAY